MPSSTCQRACAICCAICGVVLLVVAFAGKAPLHKFIDQMIVQQVRILPGSATYDNWVKPPVPVHDDIYLFNITNPVEFNNGSIAILDVIGPFVYSKNEVKLQPNFTGDLEFASYFDGETFTFLEEDTRMRNTKTNLNSTIFIPNLPLLTVVAQIAHNKLLPAALKKACEELIVIWEQEHGLTGLTLNGTVQEILWGKEDPIMKELFALGLAPSPKLALQVNGSTDADALTKPTVVYTGKSDISQVDGYHSYHGRSSSTCWGSAAANVINGSEGTMFEPLFIYNKSRPVTIYNDQLFRSVQLEFVRESSYKDLPCYVYKIPDWALQNMQNNPTNEAYYAYIYSGLLNITQCAQNVPLYLSKSMFLDADTRLLENITLHVAPNRTLHDTYLCIEPYTGAVIDGHKRVQISVQIEQYPILGVLNQSHPAFVPLISVDEHGSITPDLISELRTKLLIPIFIAHISFYILIALGVFVLLVSFAVHVKSVADKYKVKEDEEVLVHNEAIQAGATGAESSEHSEKSDLYLSFDGRNSRYYDIDPDS